MPKLGMPGNFFFGGGDKHRYFAYLSFLAYQRNVKLFYEMLDTLIKALTSFTVRKCYLSRQTDWQIQGLINETTETKLIRQEK